MSCARARKISNKTYPVSNPRLTRTSLRERSDVVHLWQYTVSVLLDRGHQVDDDICARCCFEEGQNQLGECLVVMMMMAAVGIFEIARRSLVFAS